MRTFDGKLLLDCAAGIPLTDGARLSLGKIVDYGNPNAFYSSGISSALQIAKVEQRLKSLINGERGEIYWTTSGSHANVLAIQDIQRKRSLLVSTDIEHKSILELFPVRTIKVSIKGKVIDEKDNYHQAFAVQLVNNETGLILQPPRRSALHIDACQALGKIPINVEELGCTSMSFSSAKVGGPRGLGVLWISDNYSPFGLPYLGTPSTRLIQAFGEALKTLPEKVDLLTLRANEIAFLELLESIGGVHNFPEMKRVPGILSMRFPGNLGVDLAIKLDHKFGIWTCTGSSCNSASIIPSQTIVNLGGSFHDAQETIRLSFTHKTKLSDLHFTADAIAQCIKEI